MFEFIVHPIKLRWSKDREYYKILKELFGIYPNNIELYKLALIHRSASLFLSDGTPINNERLEFLGDAIIEAIVSDYLFIEHPEEDEGYLTKLRSKIVSRQTLNRLAADLGLDKYIVAHNGGNYTHKHISGDALEAMIGAIYLDKGYEFANRLLINKILRDQVNIAQLTQTENDFKSRLIEWGQKQRRTVVFHSEHSPKYTSKTPCFLSNVLVDNISMGSGEGDSKKAAEQTAALNTLELLKREPEPAEQKELENRTTEQNEAEQLATPISE